MKTKIVIKTILYFIIFFIGLNTLCFAQNQKNNLLELKLKIYFNDIKAKSLIQKKLLKTKGIKKIIVDFNTKIATITFDSDKCNRIIINNAIEKLGFQTDFLMNEFKARKLCSDSVKVNAETAR